MSKRIKLAILVTILSVLANISIVSLAFDHAQRDSILGQLGLMVEESLISSVALAEPAAPNAYLDEEPTLPTAQNTSLVSSYVSPEIKTRVRVLASPRGTYQVTLTAYSSSVDETDSTPFITASGSRTRDGVIAANFLPFGTRVRIPELFGDRVFVVEDRMHQKNNDKVDVWFPSKSAALNFGKRTARIEVF